MIYNLIITEHAEATELGIFHQLEDYPRKL